jgi:hypothetical protein
MKTEPLILSSRATYLNYFIVILIDLGFGLAIYGDFIRYLSTSDKHTLIGCLIMLFVTVLSSFGILKDTNEVWIEGGKIYVKNIFRKKEFDLDCFDYINREWNYSRIYFTDESSYSFNLKSTYAPFFSFSNAKILNALNDQINEMKKNLPA